MHVETKFNVGDRVYCVESSNRGDKAPPCWFCDRNGFVVVKGRERLCPNCHGTRNDWDADGMPLSWVAVTEPLVISAVYASWTGDEQTPSIVYDDDNTYGQGVNERYVTATYEEAVKLAEALNAEAIHEREREAEEVRAREQQKIDVLKAGGTL